MHDARDAEDALLLERGDHETLIAAYKDVVVQRCLVGTRDESGYDVAQNVFLRLWQELRRGKRHTVPYRVVVHKVVDWTLKEHFAGGRTELPLPEGWDPADRWIRTPTSTTATSTRCGPIFPPAIATSSISGTCTGSRSPRSPLASPRSRTRCTRRSTGRMRSSGG